MQIMSSPGDTLEALISKGLNGFIPENYCIDGILNFLQNEWNKMELQRIQWEVEKAEMQARIAFLQGEKTGQENLKQDLIRRIKMLEYALVQERSRNQTFHSLQFSSSSNPLDCQQLFSENSSNNLHSKDKDDDLPQHSDSNDPNNSMNTSRHELLKIRNMLKDLGLGETVSQLRQARVKQLLGIQQANQQTKIGKEIPQPQSKPDVKQQQHSQAPPPPSLNLSQPEDDSATVLANFDFLCTSPTSSPSKQTDWSLDELQNDTAIKDSGDYHHQKVILDDATASAIFDVLVSQELDSQTQPRLNTIQVMQEWDNLSGNNSSSTKSLSILNNNPMNNNSVSPDPRSSEWAAVDQQVIAKLKERYKQERAGKRHSASPSITPAQSSDEMDDSLSKDMSELDDDSGDDGSLLYPYENIPNEVESSYSTKYLQTKKASSSSSATVSPRDLLASAATSVVAGGAAAASNLLGDLASVTIANEMEEKQTSLLNDDVSAFGGGNDSASGVANSGDNSGTNSRLKQHQWTAKYTLRSHFDGVRAMQFHSTEPLLVTASEDHTLKLWNLNKTVPAKKSQNWDVEPVHTLRGHSSPVLACQLHPTRDQELYSADLQGKVILSRLSTPMTQHHDPYEAFDSNSNIEHNHHSTRWGIYSNKPLMKHHDAVWSLAVHPQAEKLESYDSGYLLSASSDGTVCLWQPTDMEQPMRHIYKIAGGQSSINNAEIIPNNSLPTCIVYSTQSLQHFIVSTTSGSLLWIDMETGQTIQQTQPTPIPNSTIGGNNETTNNPAGLNRYQASSSLHCYRVLSHPTMPLAISGHGDGAIRFYDQNTAKLTNCMVAHLDAVTSLAVDPTANHLQIVSGSHDCSIRLWSIHNHICVQELTSHRRKLDEAIHDVAFHPEKRYLASAGADGLAKVYI